MNLQMQTIVDEAKDNATLGESRNIDTVIEYMTISYTPGRASADAVRDLCADGNKFIAPTTFPVVHTLEKYADDHGELMKSISDLHFVSFDSLFASRDRVCLRYTAEGTHNGAAWGSVQPTHRTATWTAAAIFNLEDGKIVEFIKDWNKLSMWEQLQWPLEECYSETIIAKAKRMATDVISLGGALQH